MNQPNYILCAAADDAVPALTLGQGFPKEVNSLPAFYYWRPAIKDGTYKHPVKGWTLSVDAARRKKWEAAFRRREAAGDRTPIVEDHSVTARKTLGYVVDVKQDGPWLKELHQYLGEEARDIALKNFVSVGIVEQFKDNAGNDLGETIEHSGIVPNPVVTGQGDAVRVAASSGQQSRAGVFLLAANEGGAMPTTISEPAFLKFKELLGGDGITTDNVVEKLTERLSKADPQVETLKQQLSRTEAELVEAKKLSRGDEPVKIDPEVLADRAEIARGKIELSVERGDMPPAIGKKLAAAIAPEAKGIGFMLSRSAELGNRPVDFVLDLFKESKLGVKAGTRTGVQTLSRGEADDNKPTDGYDAEWAKQRAKAI